MAFPSVWPQKYRLGAELAKSTLVPIRNENYHWDFYRQVPMCQVEKIFFLVKKKKNEKIGQNH
jgi:hypothetical protein